MADQMWAKLESWHVVNPDDHGRTRCGLEISDEVEVVTWLPPDWYEQKSCETCLRIMAGNTFGKEG